MTIRILDQALGYGWPTVGLDQQPKPLDALKRFREAAHQLNRVWRECEEQGIEGVLDAQYPFPQPFAQMVDQIDRWFEANRPTTPLERAHQQLVRAGLYVRPLGEAGILGGSHYDASGSIRVVENGFMIAPEGEWYRLRTALMAQTDGVGNLTLDQAVQQVIDTIKPQPNIEAPPTPPQKGPVCY